MRARTLLPFALAALAGAAIAVLPALAAPPEAKLEVNENCVENDWPCWALPGSGAKPDPAGKVTIAAGGVVTFVDHSTAANIVWTGAAPTCEPSVPVNTTAKTGWEGKCTFEKPGTYKFESASLYFAYTKYEIEVQATGTTGSTPTGTGTGSEGELVESLRLEHLDLRLHAGRLPGRLGRRCRRAARLAVRGQRILGLQAPAHPARPVRARLPRRLPGRRRRAPGSRAARRTRVARERRSHRARAGGSPRALVAAGRDRQVHGVARRQGQACPARSRSPRAERQARARLSAGFGRHAHAERCSTSLSSLLISATTFSPWLKRPIST